MKGRILIVDDDPNALRLIQYALGVEGYEVSTAENGAQALAAIARAVPDLVVLDVMMPDMSGIEVCRQLRADPETSHLPILMLSAKGKVEDRVTGLRAGADDYVPKPVDPSELAARVEALLARATRGQPARTRAARFIAFLGAKGGVGTSTVVANVGLALSQGDSSVVLVDLQPHLGTICAMLGLDSPHSVSELTTIEPQLIQLRDIEARLAAFSTGLKVLASSDEPPDEDRTLSPAHVEALLDGLATAADYILFDLPSQTSPITRSVVRRCHGVVLVTEPDPLALSCGRGKLALLRQWGIMGELVTTAVVNRSSTPLSTSIKDVRDVLGAPIAGVVPPAPEASLHALRSHRPLLLARPGDTAARMLEDLARRLAEEPAAVGAAVA